VTENMIGARLPRRIGQAGRYRVPRMTCRAPRFVLLLALVSGCDSRESLERVQLARFPTGQIFEDDEDPDHSAWRGLPKCLRVEVPVIGRGVCVPQDARGPDGARVALRNGVWTYEYVKAERRVSGDGTVSWHFRDLVDTSIGLEAQGEYVNNKYQGPWTFWHLNGEKRAAGVLVDDSMSGAWMFWLPDGSVDAGNSGVYEHNVRKSGLPAQK
jgi:hypothetical protein